jgi:MYXO-CTERM domain-containing protein
MALANLGGVVGAPDLGAQELGCEIPIYGVRPEGVDENAGPPKCGGGGSTDGTGGGETGGDDTMIDDSGTTGGDAGDGGDLGGAGGTEDSASSDDKGGCGCGTRSGSAGWMAITAFALLVHRRRQVCHER